MAHLKRRLAASGAVIVATCEQTLHHYLHHAVAVKVSYAYVVGLIFHSLDVAYILCRSQGNGYVWKCIMALLFLHHICGEGIVFPCISQAVGHIAGTRQRQPIVLIIRSLYRFAVDLKLIVLANFPVEVEGCIGIISGEHTPRDKYLVERTAI